MTRAVLSRFAPLVAVLLAACGMFGAVGCTQEPGARPTANPASKTAVAARPADATTAPAASAVPVAGHAEIGFRAAGALADHFAKHGAEFGTASPAAYLALAQSLRDAPSGGNIVQAVRADHVVCRYDRATGAFLAFNADLTVRTFFKPIDGEDYFRRQLEREH